ncbi:MAG: hypothetical protein MJA31_15250, partial [Clostridia bacterium]|nr:hypothetical protein [Clostridia bacterium]
MDCLELLRDNMDSFDIGEIFNTDSNPDWVWVNKLVFSDIIYGICESEEIEDSDIKNINEQDMFKILEEIFDQYHYAKINQHLFASWEKEYKPTKDIETVIFVKDKIYRKICIDSQNRFGWFLKAIAVDTYYKINSEFSSLVSCYKEMYEDNYRIIEDILSLFNYQYVSGNWEYVPKDNVLLFTKDNQLMNIWTEEEANSFYNEIAL